MLIKTEKDIIQSYFEDHSGLLGGFADQVAFPESEEEVADQLRQAAHRKTPVTVSGAGTGVTGARVPFGGMVLSLERMNRILDLRSDRRTAVLQPGVTVADLKNAAEKSGLMYAPDPTEQSSFIGGNVSTNASGSRGFKFGSTRRYIKRIKVVLSTGETLELSRGSIAADHDRTITLPLSSGHRKLPLPRYHLPRIKNAAGYYNYAEMDLIDLFIGQEGTLGVITEIETELSPPVNTIFGGVAFFRRKESAWEMVEEARRLSRRAALMPASSRIDALCLEYFDRHALELLKPDYPQIPDGIEAALLFEQAANDIGEQRLLETWSKLLEKHHAPLDSVWFAANKNEQEAFRAFRHALPEKVNQIVKKNRLPKVGTDIAVPDEHLREMLEYYQQRFEESAMEYLVFGHIGDSHLHANILPRTELEYTRCRSLYLELVEKALSLGGTVSAEHGIGKLKHIFLEKMVGEYGLREMARVKKLIDPSCILGLNNVFPAELLFDRKTT